MEHRSLTCSVASCRRIANVYGKYLPSESIFSKCTRQRRPLEQASVQFSRSGRKNFPGKPTKSGGAREAYTHPIAIMHVLLTVFDSTYRLTIIVRRRFWSSENSFISFTNYFATCASRESTKFRQK